MDVIFGLCVILTIFVAYCYVRQNISEGFVSEQATKLSGRLTELFKDNSHVNYSLFRKVVPGADPVKHADAHRLNQESRLNPTTVQEYLL